MRLRVLAIAALVVVIVAGALVAYFVLLSPNSSAQNRASGSNVSVSGTKVGHFDAQAAFASYVGKWEVHGSLLTINAGRTGLESWNVGPCTQSSTETQLCNGNAKIIFTVNPDGSIKGTIQSVWYTQWSGTPVPAGFQPNPEDPQAGDTFELRQVKTHLLYTTWFGARQSNLNSGNRYWCDSSTSPADRPLCGA
jgi:hypothetical protein